LEKKCMLAEPAESSDGPHHLLRRSLIIRGLDCKQRPRFSVDSFRLRQRACVHLLPIALPPRGDRLIRDPCRRDGGKLLREREVAEQPPAESLPPHRKVETP